MWIIVWRWLLYDFISKIKKKNINVIKLFVYFGKKFAKRRIKSGQGKAGIFEGRCGEKGQTPGNQSTLAIFRWDIFTESYIFLTLIYVN